MIKNKNIFYYVLFFVAIFIFWFLSKRNYLLFHSIIELFAILTAFCIVFLSYITFKYLKNNLILNLGTTYLFVVIVDILHTLSYKGMGVFKTFDANLPTQLWILGRTLETIGLSLIIFLKEKLNKIIYFSILLLFTSIELILIFLRKFPQCFIEGKGLTSFKIGMEYLFIFILGLTLIYIITKKDLPKIFLNAYIYTIVFTILGELSFTLYTDVYGFFNMLGHLFRFVSYLIILFGINSKFLIFTIENLTDQLQKEREKYKHLAEYDQLTGLYTRNFFNEWILNNIQKLKQDEKEVLVIMDIDNFKEINDKYGHLQGDEVLKFVGRTMIESFRVEDILVRFGGDEFLIILKNIDLEKAEKVINRFIEKLSFNKFPFNLTISYGVSEFKYNNYLEILKITDLKMLEMKNKKNK